MQAISILYDSSQTQEQQCRACALQEQPSHGSPFPCAHQEGCCAKGYLSAPMLTVPLRKEAKGVSYLGIFCLLPDISVFPGLVCHLL